MAIEPSDEAEARISPSSCGAKEIPFTEAVCACELYTYTGTAAVFLYVQRIPQDGSEQACPGAACRAAYSIK